MNPVKVSVRLSKYLKVKYTIIDNFDGKLYDRIQNILVQTTSQDIRFIPLIHDYIYHQYQIDCENETETNT